VFEVIDALKTDSLEWVATPYGVHDFIEPAVAAGLKLSPGFMDVQWKGREYPKPKLHATFDAGFPGERQVGKVEVLPGSMSPMKNMRPLPAAGCNSRVARLAPAAKSA